MDDRQTVWQELGIAFMARGARDTVGREVISPSGVRVFRSLAHRDAWPEPQHQLLILLRSHSVTATRILPTWDGLEIEAELHDVADIRRGIFLVLRQSLPGTAQVFASVADDICEAVRMLDASEDLAETVSARLGIWKTFFDEHGLDGLSPEARRGLYGELWFLRERLTPVTGIEDAVRAWAGPHRAQQDFTLHGVAIEVKTTVAVQHRRVSIASARQLDDAGLRSLLLAVVSLSEQDRGETLPEIVRDVEQRAASAGAAVTMLYREALRAAGYLEADAPRYATGHVFRALQLYQVREGFPRILERDLLPGIGEVRYQVELGACAPFLVDDTSLQQLMIAQVPPLPAAGGE